MAETNPLRDAYRKEFIWCQRCGRAAAEDIHEITAGSAREKALSHRETWLLLCRTCHDIVQGEVVAKQCAMKAIYDPAYFNLKVINAIRGRDENAIEWSDVAHFLTLR